jgi:TonB family protein
MKDREKHTFGVAQVRCVLGFLLLLIALLASLAVALSADSDRKVRNRVVPVYPELARKLKLVANVKVQVTVAPNGSVLQAKALGGHPLLITPSVDAARMWRYEPAASTTTNTIEFHFGPGAE